MNKHKTIPKRKLFVMDINHILIASNGFYIRALLCIVVNRKGIVTPGL